MRKTSLSIFVAVSVTLGSGACSVLVNNKKVLKKAQKALTVTAADASLTSDHSITNFRDPNQLAYARWNPTLIEITGGRIMILGGTESTSTEIFDPAGNGGLGTLSLGPSLNVRRNYFTFTKLNDGRILAAGGLSGNTNVLTTVELFDPTANGGEGAWTLGPDLPLKRYSHTATKLNDGRVLLAGGRSTGDTNTSVIFDPTANSGAGSWTAVPSNMPAGTYYGHEATLLPDGRVMASGGTNGGWPAATAIFDPTANAGAGSWSSGTSMGVPRWLHRTTVLNDGRVLFTGGTGTSGSITSVELLNPAGNAGAGSWTTGTALPQKQNSHENVLLNDGRVLHIGTDYTGAQNTVLIFNPTANAGAGSWTTVTPSATSARDRAAVHKFANGKVLLVGGNKVAGNDLIGVPTIELFDPAGNAGAGSWQTMLGPSAVTRRYEHNAVSLDDGRTIFLNGIGYGGRLKSVTIFDPSANDGAGEFTEGPDMSAIRGYSQPVKLKDGRVMVAGGDDGPAFFTSLSSVEIFDPEANSGAGAWSAGPSLPAPRTRYIATVLSDGRVVLLGGSLDLMTSYTSTVIFDPAANSGAGAWTTGPSPLDASRMLNFGAIFMALEDGNALLFGGQRATAEIFNPDGNAGAGEWTSTGSTNFARLSPSATRLSDGRVMMSGGMRDFSDYMAYTARTDVEIYDPQLGTWSNGTPLLTPRFGHGFVEHTSGQIYAMAGWETGLQHVATSMEAFDPTANAGVGAWTTATPTFDPPISILHTQTMGDGRIALFSEASPSTYAYVSLFETTTLSVTGGIPPYTAGILSGQGSLTVNAANGNMTLMPTDFGTVKIQVTDGRGVKGTVEVTVN